MAALSISVPTSTQVGEGKDAYTGYEVLCKYGTVEWTVIKRYSQFLDLKNRMEKETIRPSAPFPKKGGIVALSASAMAKRREGLHDYMVELSGSFLPEHLHAVLCDFVEMKQRLAKAEKDAAGEAPPLVAGGEAFPNVAPLVAALPPAASPSPAAASTTAGGAADAASGSGGSGRKASWSASFMSEDPLAGLLQPDSPPPPAASKPAAAASNPKPPQQQPSAAAAAAPPPAAAAAPLPSFFSHAAKKYDASGEGLRDAIKAGDVNGCKQVITAAGNSVALYQDRQTMTMLHLAAIFNNAPIADLLLASGADPMVKNSEGESAMDVAQPTMKLKMKQIVENRATGV